jgi:hypothetical protein
MSEFHPISTLEDLSLQDREEMAAGYRSGIRGEPEPGSNKSRAHWHGWRNGRVDGGYADKDAAQIELARRYYQRQAEYLISKARESNGRH